jgi:hypothetical protein
MILINIITYLNAYLKNKAFKFILIIFKLNRIKNFYELANITIKVRDLRSLL